ncbi:MAG: enoyl-CoA hydratase/isomerase family protein [Chloroflexi bacterium]|nr:enoyl-CoA hydratase/isomerase family protein [Chloroflexota bacterium]
MPDFLYEVQDGIAVMTLNRPDRLNAMSREMMRGLLEACDRIDNDREVRVAIFTAVGRSFSAGADLKGMAAGGEAVQEAEGLRPELVGIYPESRLPYRRLLKVTKPIICGVNGFAMGGGLNLTLPCDIRIASENAVFAAAEVRWSLTSGFMCALLTQLVGASNAAEMLLRGHRLDAQEALRIGLVSRVVPQDRLMPTCLEVAREIAANAPLAVLAMKEMIRLSLYSNLEAVVAVDDKVGALLRVTEDAKEGPRAFAEKRPAAYRGR